MSSSAPRFYLPPEDWRGEFLTLSEGESRHAAQVLRLQTGDDLTLFDGCGRHQSAVIESIARNRVEIRLKWNLNEPIRQVARPEPAITLVAAIIKGKAWDWLLQKATELGAAAIQPLLTDHCVVQMEPSEFDDKLEKWRPSLVEAAKQCGTPWLPKLHPPLTLEAWLNQPIPKSELRLWASLHPQACSPRHAVEQYQQAHGKIPASIQVAIGPEGDFSAKEIVRLNDSPLVPIGLGPFTLRAETASLAALAILRNEFQ